MAWFKKLQLGGLVYESPPTKMTTQLTPAEEQSFQDWYKRYAAIHGLDPNPDDPLHYYDYRGYWKNGLDWNDMYTMQHLTDKYKRPGHESFSDESIYNLTIDDLADFTGAFETFRPDEYTLKEEKTKKRQKLAGYGSTNPEIRRLAREGKLTEEIARKELLKRLQSDYDEWNRLVPNFKNLPREVQLALVDTSYNGRGVQEIIKRSPKLMEMINAGITDPEQLVTQMDHSKSAGGWLGVRSAARRAMALGEYDWNWEDKDKYGRHVQSSIKGSQDWKSSPYYNKYQRGGLVYSPFIQDYDTSEQVNQEDDVFTTLPEQSTPFKVEPVKAYTPQQFEIKAEAPKEEIKKRGRTTYKKEGIDVGNMRELLDKFEEAGISVRVTSGAENRKTKSGKTSKHAVSNAIDITPGEGETYESMREKIKASPELLAYMQDNGIGIIDETDPLMMIRTGATGKHWHISRGGERLAIHGFNKLFG